MGYCQRPHQSPVEALHEANHFILACSWSFIQLGCLEFFLCEVIPSFSVPPMPEIRAFYRILNSRGTAATSRQGFCEPRWRHTHKGLLNKVWGIHWWVDGHRHPCVQRIVKYTCLYRLFKRHVIIAESQCRDLSVGIQQVVAISVDHVIANRFIRIYMEVNGPGVLVALIMALPHCFHYWPWEAARLHDRSFRLHCYRLLRESAEAL